jgi:hypothetical protein
MTNGGAAGTPRRRHLARPDRHRVAPSVTRSSPLTQKRQHNPSNHSALVTSHCLFHPISNRHCGPLENAVTRTKQTTVTVSNRQFFAHCASGSGIRNSHHISGSSRLRSTTQNRIVGFTNRQSLFVTHLEINRQPRRLETTVSPTKQTPAARINRQLSATSPFRISRLSCTLAEHHNDPRITGGRLQFLVTSHSPLATAFLTNRRISNRHSGPLEIAVTSTKQTTAPVSNRHFFACNRRINHNSRTARGTTAYSRPDDNSRARLHQSPLTNHQSRPTASMVYSNQAQTPWSSRP